MRVSRIGRATLYLGKAEEVLPDVEVADLVLTDPPYEVSRGSIHHHTNPSANMYNGWLGTDYPVNHGKLFAVPKFEEWAQVVYDAAALNSDAYFMVNDKEMGRLRTALEAAGWKLHNILVWQKPTGIPNRWYFKNCEFVLYMWKGLAKTIRNPASYQTFQAGPPKDRVHNSQKPVSLMCHYVMNSSDKGDLVLDPFMGSGTTGVACAKTGRRFIGVETDPEYFETACKRIKAAYEEGDLFVDRVDPTQRDMDL